MQEKLLDSTYLYRFALPCYRYEGSWTGKALSLDETYGIANFGVLDGRPSFADLRVGWNDDGLFLRLQVFGKQKSAWGRASRVEDSDGLRIWVDTRDTHTIHRANRFCHGYCVLPVGRGSKSLEPMICSQPINRATELPKQSNDELLRIRSEQRPDGYVIDAWIPQEVMTGFQPEEYPKLGFMYAVADRELGLQTLGVTHPFRFMEDPSLWGTLELVTR